MELKIINTLDGSNTLLVEEMGEHYHSTYGAINESMHVYISNGLKPKIDKNNDIKVLEIGFGTGLNTFLTYIESYNKNVLIDYTTIEPFPVDTKLIEQLNYPNIISNSFFEKEFSQIHYAVWNQKIVLSPKFSLLKIKNKLEDVELIDNTYDVVYFDAFAPDFQPELWSSTIFEKVFKTMKSNAILMTYSAKGSVKRALKSAGFSVFGIAGPIGKREITKALKI